uniref:Uncharacterized protein n=1 Tax=Arundo donax TaxID=35708 RepID=A0A0A9EE68_ARUDO
MVQGCGVSVLVVEAFGFRTRIVEALNLRILGYARLWCECVGSSCVNHVQNWCLTDGFSRCANWVVLLQSWKIFKQEKAAIQEMALHRYHVLV